MERGRGRACPATVTASVSFSEMKHGFPGSGRDRPVVKLVSVWWVKADIPIYNRASLTGEQGMSSVARGPVLAMALVCAALISPTSEAKKIKQQPPAPPP